ncbi:MAG TPA: CHASE2 domain-containing protein [Anaerolineae bacterium]
MLEPIGQGGEAAVWSAWDNLRQRVVAIKIISSHHRDPAMASQLSGDFERQVQLVTTIKHPHILPLYEFGATDTNFYFVMRYNCAGSLADRLEAGPLPLGEVLRLTAQITAALTYLHMRGIVHRDLKPSNILLDSQNRVYLTDFGLAKRLTQETVLLHTGRGTGPYAPYEQYAHHSVTQQSDIYSLGIVIYEMLTGQLPWEGTTTLASVQHQDNEELPDPRKINPDLPSSLAPVLQRLTAFNWRDRPESATEAFHLLVETLPSKVKEELVEPRKALSTFDEGLLAAQDTQYLLELFLSDWDASTQEFPARLTHLAYIHATYSWKKSYPAGINDADANRFMLRGALVHDYHLDYWWEVVSDPRLRSQVCAQAIATEDETVAGRVMAWLLDRRDGIHPLDEPSSTGALDRLIDLAMDANDVEPGRNALAVLAHLAPAAIRWQPLAITAASDTRLAQIALDDRALGKRAARIIGQVKSETAVQVLLDALREKEDTYVLDLLDVIQAVAGTLPRSVPPGVRLRLVAHRARAQLLEDREGLSISRALIGLGAGVIASLMLVLGFFSQQTAQTRDNLLLPYPVSGVVTIVEVDDASLERYGRWERWPRTLHADLINRLHAAGARTIVLDFVFDAETPADARLVEAMRRAGNVLQPVLGQGDAIHDRTDVLRYEDRILPQADLLAASVTVGHVNVLHDEDGYVRRVPTIIAADGERYPSLALAAIHNYLGAGVNETPVTTEPDNGWLQSVGRRIPVGEFGEMIIYYAGPPAEPAKTTFPMISYQDVLDGTAPAELLKDKIVLVGITATAEPDRYLTPVSEGRPMYGVEILANVIESIWSRQFIRRPPESLGIVLLLLLGVLVGLTCTRPLTGFILAVGIALIYFIVAALLFDLTGVMLDLFFPWVVIALGYIAVTAYRFSIVARHRRQIADLSTT